MTVKQFINLCANELGINLLWKNKGLKEVAIDTNNNKTIKINIGTAINPSADNKQNIDGLIHRVEKALITLSGGAYEVK